MRPVDEVFAELSGFSFEKERTLTDDESRIVTVALSKLPRNVEKAKLLALEPKKVEILYQKKDGTKETLNVLFGRAGKIRSVFRSRIPF